MEDISAHIFTALSESIQSSVSLPLGSCPYSKGVQSPQ